MPSALRNGRPASAAACCYQESMGLSTGTPTVVLDADHSAAASHSGAWLLLRLKARCFRNLLLQTIAREPLKLLASGVSIAIIWLGLYLVLHETFQQVRSQVLEGVVAIQLIFSLFFLALMGMLIFSNAILAYGTLFRRQESHFLMATPLSLRDVVVVKYLESLFLSSWSLMLMGFPMMLAIAHSFDEDWTFYPLFIGIFLMFIPIPGALGLVLAWLMALLAPKNPRRSLALTGIFLALIGGWWMWRIMNAPVSSSEWLNHFYDRIAPLQNGLWPHEWSSKGIEHAIQGRTSEALFYLYVTFANSLFVSLIAVALVAGRFTSAFARAQISSARSHLQRGRRIAGIADSLVTPLPQRFRPAIREPLEKTLYFLRYRKVDMLAEVMFAYLPRRLRLLARKDLQTFFRDPMQWSQMMILLGLMILYIFYAQNRLLDLGEAHLRLLVSFLNLTAVSLILATFTSRFVFPLVSLEGQQAWMLGLLPLPRSHVILAKFLYALTITMIAAMAVTLVSVYRLGLPTPLILTHVIAMASICIGLCGVSIGLGARMPVFTERNPARIAGGFGGTLSLLVSVGLVILALSGMAIMTWNISRTTFGDTWTTSMIQWTLGVAAVNIIAATITLAMGVRHFQRLQF